MPISSVIPPNQGATIVPPSSGSITKISRTVIDAVPLKNCPFLVYKDVGTTNETILFDPLLFDQYIISLGYSKGGNSNPPPKDNITSNNSTYKETYADNY